MGLNPLKIYVFSTVTNFADLLSSYLAFMHGFVELNGFMSITHNSYIACALSIVVFQLLITAVYYVSRYYANVSIINVVLGIAKVMVAIHNISLYV
jgi:uncharacterized membrane protein